MGMQQKRRQKGHRYSSHRHNQKDVPIKPEIEIESLSKTSTAAITNAATNLFGRVALVFGAVV
jgi:hypothetical protein